MVDIEIALEAARNSIKGGGEFSDVVVQRRAVTQVRFEDGTVDDISVGTDWGAGVRVIRGNLAAYAHTDAVDREHLIKAASLATEALKHSTDDTTLNISSSKRSGPTSPVCPDSFDKDEIRKIVGHLEKCDEAARSISKDVRQVTAIHFGSLEDEMLVNSLGEVKQGTCVRTRLIVQVVAGRDGLIQVGQEAPGALSGPDFYERTDPEKVAKTAARRALTMLGARPSPTGRMPVVINSGTGGVLLHEACGHGLEADHVQKGVSVYAGKIGQVVACELVTALDDPTLPGLWGSYDFDDEGTPSGGTVLIEDGVLKNFLYGRHESMRDGTESTGNGRRQSYRNTPIPRMSNTYIKPGNADPADIITSTRRGIYAKKLGGGQVDPTTGDYVFAVSESYLIEDGKLGQAVRGATLIGNGPRTLEIIDAVGNDLSFEEGTCGKEGQGVPVTSGGPTFRISELTVGGTEV